MQGVNLEWWLEITNRRDTTLYCVVKHVSWCFWLVWRVSWPSYLFYGMWRYTIPEHGAGGCYIMSYITGHAIFLFCLLVFFGIMTVSLLKFHGCIKDDDLQGDAVQGLRKSLSVIAWERRIVSSPRSVERLAQTVNKIIRIRGLIGLVPKEEQGPAKVGRTKSEAVLPSHSDMETNAPSKKLRVSV